MTDHVVTLADVLCRSQEYLDLACRTSDRGERELYERIVELYLKIAGELEIISDRQNTAHK
jgi:hypothetical protein